jgi:hypothetical protein
VVTIVRNLGLDDVATGLQTGTVGEPSAATSGNRILVTGNWFASRSTDRGATWSALDPFTELPSAAGGFCCDQLVHYVRSRRLWVWFLQYSARSGANVVRIAVSRTGAGGSWTWWDVAPTDVDPGWRDLWFDYPDLAESADHLWVSLNVYDSADQWRRAVVLRFPLDDLVAGGALSRRHWATTGAGSLRLVQGAGDTMWFASHAADNRRLLLFAWPDDATDVRSWAVPVTPWSEASYSSRGPGGAEWLSRADGRITGAWRGEGALGFVWTAGPRPGRPHPYVRAVRVEEATLRVRDEPDLWSETGAWAYPAAAVNDRGQVGLAAFFGGPTHPAHAVGVLDETTGAWDTAVTATSTHGPLQGKWGDYLTVRRHPGRPTSWLASGYTLQGGTDRRNVEPRVVVFRR